MFKSRDYITWKKNRTLFLNVSRILIQTKVLNLCQVNCEALQQLQRTCLTKKLLKFHFSIWEGIMVCYLCDFWSLVRQSYNWKYWLPNSLYQVKHEKETCWNFMTLLRGTSLSTLISTNHGTIWKLKVKLFCFPNMDTFLFGVRYA